MISILPTTPLWHYVIFITAILTTLIFLLETILSLHQRQREFENKLQKNGLAVQVKRRQASFVRLLIEQELKVALALDTPFRLKPTVQHNIEGIKIHPIRARDSAKLPSSIRPARLQLISSKSTAGHNKSSLYYSSQLILRSFHTRQQQSTPSFGSIGPETHPHQAHQTSVLLSTGFKIPPSPLSYLRSQKLMPSLGLPCFR